MIQRGPLLRSTFLALVFSSAFFGVAYRLFDLQVVRHDELRAIARGLHERKEYLPPIRGMILDAKNNVLAQTVTVWKVIADPELMRPQTSEWTRLLAERISMPAREVGEKIGRPGRYVILKSDVGDEDVQKLQAELKELNRGRKRDQKLVGLRLEKKFQRYYPNGYLASQVLGFARNETEEFDGQPMDYQRGVDGVEKYFDQELTGSVGYRRIEKNRHGAEMVAFRGEDVPPRNGNHVVLTIDQAIQDIVEEELERVCQEKHPKAAVAIVVRPDTGEVLALANRPTYDLNDPKKDVNGMKNHAIMDAYEPGSTFKTVIVTAALDQRLTKLDDSYYCENGKWLYAGKFLHDHKPYGWLNVRQIIAFSSNIGAAKVALRLGDELVYRYVKDFGFGEPSGIQLPGEAGGIARAPKDYTKLSITRIAMGHEVTATPLQITMAVCAMANGGNLMKPMIVKKIVDEKGDAIREFVPVVRRRPVDKPATAQITEAMIGVVTADGTAVKAALPGFVVAGKTGTAEKVEHGVYVSGKYYSSFVGFFPAEKPQLCCMVGIDESKDYGGQVAAPVFQQIAQRCVSYLGLEPTKPVSSYASLRRNAR
ncbi:MAG: penicillin-binding protein 2 [Verrucomicrobiae bacterium]|nr:penicillin-binding protein 2 [Verrucomicrobiae bacterium]